MTQNHTLLYEKWRFGDLLVAILGSISLFCALVEYEYSFYLPVRYPEIGRERNQIRGVAVLTSLGAVCATIYRYWFKIKWRNLPIPKQLQSQVYNNDYTHFVVKNRYSSFLSYKLLRDILILSLCPLPSYDHLLLFSEYLPGNAVLEEKEYLLSDFVLVGMFLKLRFVLRCLLNYTEFSDLYAKLHCERHGFVANSTFCFKCYLRRFPGFTVLCTLSSSVFILSYLHKIVERPFKPYHADWINCAYATIITMTTVGYGDYVPVTRFGKILAIFTALWGGFLISLLIVSINGIFALNEAETNAFEKLIKLRSAVNCITSALKLQVLKRKLSTKDQNTSKLLEKARREFEGKISKFKKVSNRVKEIKVRKDPERSSSRNLEAEVQNLNKRFDKLEQMLEKVLQNQQNSQR